MVSSLSITFMIVSAIISIFIPIALVIYLIKKKGASLKAVLIGALTFFVSQMLLRIPLLQLLQTMDWFKSLGSNVFLASIFLGITAGLFEEIGRFVSFKFLLKNKLNWINGIAFGVGHGGIEAILLVGIGNINNIIYSMMINSGMFDSAMAAALPAEIAGLLKDQLLNLEPYVFLLGGIERIFALIIQITFSLLVLYGVMNKSFKYVIYAILLHMVVNAPLGILSSMGISVIGIEVFVGICATIGLVFIIKSKSMFNDYSEKTF